MRVWPTVVCGTLLSSAATPAPVVMAGPQGSGSWHENPRFGFKFRPPKKWSEIPLKRGEQWMVAKYMSDKTYFYTDKDDGWTWEHRPELIVVAFVDAVVNKKRAEEKVDTDGDGRTDATFVADAAPYRDYEDFLDRTYTGGGFYIDDKDVEEAQGARVTKYSIKVEKLALTGPKRITTWVYHSPEVDFAAQVEVLEDEYSKLERLVEGALKSFQFIEREGELPTGSGDTWSDLGFITIEEMAAGTPEDRRKARLESEKREHEEAIAGLAEGWEHEMVGDVLVLHHDELDHARRVAEHLSAFREWLEDTFEHVGKDEYVRKPILRMCKDFEEENSFAKGHRGGDYGWYSTGIELVTHDDEGGFLDSWEVGWCNQRFLDHWFHERDRDLYDAMPRWLRQGMLGYLDGARAKGKKIEFRSDDWSRDDLRLMVSQGRATPPRELMMLTSAEFFGNDASVFDRMDEAQGLVRFMLSPEGQRNKLVRDTLLSYLQNLDAVVGEMEKNDDGKAETVEPKTEQEEEEMYRKRQESWSKREKQVLEDVFFRTFRTWSDRDWKKFEKAYFDYVG